MIQFGTRTPKLTFNNESQYYYALGVITKSIENDDSEIVREDNQNQGAWGEEYRIRVFQNPNNIVSNIFGQKFTAGVGSVVGRINNNEYVSKLVNDHHLPYKGQSINTTIIRSTVPQNYRADFDRGFNCI